jgi:hypothetical protein
MNAWVWESGRVPTNVCSPWSAPHIPTCYGTPAWAPSGSRWLRDRTMFGAPMPEAPIEVNDHLARWNHDVRAGAAVGESDEERLAETATLACSAARSRTSGPVSTDRLLRIVVVAAALEGQVASLRIPHGSLYRWVCCRSHRRRSCCGGTAAPGRRWPRARRRSRLTVPPVRSGSGGGVDARLGGGALGRPRRPGPVGVPGRARRHVLLNPARLVGCLTRVGLLIL